MLYWNEITACSRLSRRRIESSRDRRRGISRLAVGGLAVILTCFSTSSRLVWAEQLEVRQITFRPLIETSQGRIDLCGVHFSVAGSSVSGRQLGVQGTVSSSFFAGKIPSVVLKVTVVEAVGEQLERRSVRSAAFFDNDKIDTAPFPQLESEDGASYFAHSDFTKSPDAFSHLQEKMLFGGVWFSFNLGDTTGDYNMRFEGSNDALAVVEEVMRCNQRGLGQVVQEIDSMD